ncbi:MAG TPA: Ig-like domain-containing protein [Gemmatimonas sp.]|nr:Ig-like domain-containing protein [Gemmatimonas sp.]
MSPRVLVRLVPTLLAIAAACGDVNNPVPVPVRTVSQVEITTPNRALVVGDVVLFAARGLTGAGEPVPDRAVSWSSTDAAVLSVTPAGQAVAIAPGSVVLRATIDGKQADIPITVSVVPVASIELSRATIALPEFGSELIVATARDAAGRALADRAVVWSTDNASVAEVDGTGRIVARAVGTATVRAAIGGKASAVAVTVVQATVASVEAGPTALVLGLSENRQLTAVVKDQANNVLTGRVVTWESDVPSIASVSPSGNVTANSPGYATITARVEGKSFSIAATIVNGELDAMPFNLIYHRTSVTAPGEIMILASNGSTAPVLLNAGNVSRSPSPSPDGTRIAFYSSFRELTTGAQIDDIYAVNRDGLNMRRLTTEPGFDGDPAWSPDGSSIAWRRIDPTTGRSSIWVMNSDGSNKTNLTADLEASYSVGAPKWSPDGGRIAFDATRSSSLPLVAGIWTMRRNGQDKQQHTSTTTGFDNAPTWAPDGERIAFIRSYGDDTDISILALNGGAVTRMPLTGRQWSPAWSPDGRHVAFWQQLGLTTAIYTVRADGTNRYLHTANLGWGGGYDPEWIR